jgi:hypothetical protein
MSSQQHHVATPKHAVEKGRSASSEIDNSPRWSPPFSPSVAIARRHSLVCVCATGCTVTAA